MEIYSIQIPHTYIFRGELQKQLHKAKFHYFIKRKLYKRCIDY